MNLYDFHDEPKSLHAHDEADYKVVKVFWDKYKDDPEELKKREKALAKNGHYAIQYALRILKKPFPEGEKAIFNEPHAAVSYARIFGIRNKDAEKLIAKNSYYSFVYAKDIIKGQWKEGEEAMARYSVEAFNYADRVLNAPFPKGEPAIAKSPRITEDYIKRFPERKDAMHTLMKADIAKELSKEG